MQQSASRRWVLIVTIVICLAGMILSGDWLFRKLSPPPAQADRFLTQAVDIGPIRRTVSASGTLNPVNLVQVGTQVSGRINAVHVDYNSNVRVGQLLAEIDAASLNAELNQVQAQLRSVQASLDQARSRLERAKSQFDRGFVSTAVLDEASTTYDTAKALLEQHQAMVSRAQTSRRQAEIRSPVSGTIVSREVAVGQTVAATLQTPVLFKIAQDLREMQIETNVSEADVGLMREGQKVSFTVDAFPDRLFTGITHQIRNNHVVQQNVVTYTVVVRARNDDLALRPGMTGYVTIVVGERNAVPRIANSALRYEPAGTVTSVAGGPANLRQVWKLDAQGQLQPVSIALGITDNRNAEITAGPLRPGDQVVIGEKSNSGFTGPKIF